jgi:hypothetical protein
LSRETDSPSSGPAGRGGAAYPSGTPPYGTPAAPPGEAAGTGEPRTETTLTTRVKINIPGSRPIPPVVLRTSVPADGAEGAATAPGEGAANGTDGADDGTGSVRLPGDWISDPAAAATGAPAGDAEPAPKKPPASDWFAPRKPVRPTGAEPAAPAAPKGQATPAEPATPANPANPANPAEQPGATQAMPTLPFRERPAHQGSPFLGAQTSPSPGPDRATGDTPARTVLPEVPPHLAAPPEGGPAVQAHGAGAPGEEFPAPGVPAPGLPENDPFAAPRPGPFGDLPPAADPQDTAAFPVPGEPFPGGDPFPGGPYAGGDPARTAEFAAPGPFAQGPGDTGEFTAPSPFPGAPAGQGPGDTGEFAAPSPFPGAPAAQGPGDTGEFAHPFPQGPGDTGEFAAPGPFPGAPADQGPGGTGDFAAPSPFPGPPAAQGPGGASGETVVSAVPGAGPGGPKPGAYHFQTAADEDVVEEPKPAVKAPAKPARKRRKGPLLIAGVVVLACVAYAAGLLKDHTDVPAGTTVFGVAIGGDSRDQAVKTLESRLGPREQAALTVRIGKKSTPLKPSAAGLGVDNQATVRQAARHSYNPVTVIGSLFSSERAADAVLLTDQDKVRAQLTKLAGQVSGGGSDGMVRFENGKAVAVPGKPQQTVDAAGSVDDVIAAYRRQLATGKPQTVTLATETTPSKVTAAKLRTAVDGFGKTAMSGLVTVRAGAAVIQFSPQISIPKFLSMRPDDEGNLTPYFDQAELKKLYGHVFDGVLLERGNGTKTPVTPADVASAMLPALRTTDPAKKDVSLPNIATP